MREDNARGLFFQRLKREGRFKAFQQAHSRIIEETGKTRFQTMQRAMVEFGYEGPKREHELYEEYVVNNSKRNAVEERRIVQASINEERMVEEFDEAIRMLPSNAPAEDEMAWIRSHPAMCRRSRQKDKTKDVIVTAHDVLYSTSGRAPSQAAAYALQHWCNCPHEFFKQVLTEDKKKTGEAEAAKPIEIEEDLQEVERLLKYVKGASSQVT